MVFICPRASAVARAKRVSCNTGPPNVLRIHAARVSASARVATSDTLFRASRG